jgi:hypothetical protein
MPRQEGHHSTMRHSRLDSSGSTASSFDELAKGLAEGSISRRRALKLFAGTAVAALIPSRAFAGGHQHGSDCPCGKGKQYICHRPAGNPQDAQTLCLPNKAAKAHLKNHPQDSPCQCPTTTPTTSTSTSTTSTTTPTTSTSTTTPGCILKGSPCTSGTQCCSGNCKGGMCVESCIPPNAIPCDTGGAGACPPNRAAAAVAKKILLVYGTAAA